MSRLPPVLAFAAPSGTGKTTLIEAVVRILVGRGVRVAVVKSDAHRVVFDKPGKDSFRFAEAGAASVAILSAERMALFARLDGEVSLLHTIERLFPEADLVLAEGFRRSGLPTLRVVRKDGPSTEGWAPPENVVGWVSDGPVPTSLPVLPLDRPDLVADWIQARFASPATARRPTLVFPIATADGIGPALAASRRMATVLDAPRLFVVAPGIAAAADVPVVTDLRPQLGLLGAVFTGLARADTPEILVVGPRHHGAPDALLRGLVAAGSPRADLVHPCVDGHPEPALTLYGHRCLSSIQSALLGGELKLTGWWGQVRTHAVPEAVWREWDPERRAFPG